MHPYTSAESLEGDRTKTSKIGILGEKARGIGNWEMLKKRKAQSAMVDLDRVVITL